MEGDRFRQSQLLPQYHFNPLPPHGGDIYRMLRIQNKIISIHSLRMEGDAVYFADPVAIEEFQSTPSAWRETSG